MKTIFVFLFSMLLAATTQADEVRGLYTKAYGSPTAPALVYLHGGPGYNSSSFEGSTVEALVRKGYYVVVFDQRGCGRSAKAANLAAFTFPAAVADLRAVIEHYELRNPVIVGHSYGGTLGVKYVEAYPNEVRALLMLDAPLDQKDMVANILDRCEEVYATRKTSGEVAKIQALRNTIFANGGYTMSTELGGQIFAHATSCGLYYPKNSSRARDARWRALQASPFANLLSNSQPEPFAGLIRNERWMSGNLIPDLSRIRNKTYAMFGADDGLFSAAQIKAIQRALPQGHVDLVIDASHNIFIDRQDEFLDYVDEVMKLSSMPH